MTQGIDTHTSAHYRKLAVNCPLLLGLLHGHRPITVDDTAQLTLYDNHNSPQPAKLNLDLITALFTDCTYAVVSDT